MPERYHGRLDAPRVVRPCPLGRWSVPRRPRGVTALVDPLKAGPRPYVGAVAERQVGLVLLDGVQLAHCACLVASAVALGHQQAPQADQPSPGPELEHRVQEDDGISR